MSNIRSNCGLAFVVVSDDGATVSLIPCNDQGNEELAKVDAALTTTATTREDAGRDGYKETARQPYKTLELALTA